VNGGIGSGKEGSHGCTCPVGLAVCIQRDERILCEPVDIGCCLPRVAIGSQVVCTHRIDDDKDQILRGFFFFEASAAKKGNEKNKKKKNKS